MIGIMIMMAKVGRSRRICTSSFRNTANDARPGEVEQRGRGRGKRGASLEIVDAAGHQVDEDLLEARFDRLDLDVRLRLPSRARTARSSAAASLPHA